MRDVERSIPENNSYEKYGSILSIKVLAEPAILVGLVINGISERQFKQLVKCEAPESFDFGKLKLKSPDITILFKSTRLLCLINA